MIEIGDIVRIKTRSGNRIGVVVSNQKKRFMIGRTMNVMIDGTIKEVLVENIELVKEKNNESP